ncbi:DoxX family protein [Lysobacter sp. 5GHs7-4]|uniref:HvfX family Cu-binding RiPP maturation protein n=1 Tax=Lysobacter sp. 5GHs7-4 TaxID=2904253 RepID=UPI001E61298F|nr:DoxX family protein [Lysobacter sp. 5GHs7-4]UHQ21972.1 DoxX family protein [Lysobacter sp. 5GHs7-4]
MPSPIRCACALRDRLEGLGAWTAPLGLRLVLAWEFYESGREKLLGENWFADVMATFPFPFDRVPADLSWGMATWFELIGGIALLIGLGTRFFAAALFVLTVVAIAAVHWPQDWMGWSQLAQGYAITDQGAGNYKLPLLFLVMLWPLILRGPGRLSVDALIERGFGPPAPQARNDATGWGVALLLFGVVAAMLLPLPGLVLAAGGLTLLTASRLRPRRLSA